MLIETTESYRLESEWEVKEFIEKVKAEASEKGYVIKSYTSTLKQKKQKGEVIDEGYLLRVTKVYSSFWDAI